MTAIREASQGFAFKLEPYVLCSYEVDCADIADLRTDAGRAAGGVRLADMACAWFADATSGREPLSWRLARRLTDAGHSGILVPSFAPGATDGDHNLVLWKWSGRSPHKVMVFDPSGRLPKNQLSWD
jgi:RES domain-containing protein